MDHRADSVIDRLKNEARKKGGNVQIYLQLFCQEEFLRRLSQSKYAENFVLKGGLFLYVLTEFTGRTTSDIDFLLQRIPNTPEKVKGIVEEIISEYTGNDFVTYELKSADRICIDKKYPGISISLVAHIKNTKTPFSIDFGFGDIIIPDRKRILIPTQLEGFDSPSIFSYSLETTIAEKLDAIMDLLEASSRMKDYYDIYHILTNMQINNEDLCKAIKETFHNRNHELSIERFNKVLCLSENEIITTRWRAFTKRIGREVSFAEVLLQIDRLLRPILEKIC